MGFMDEMRKLFSGEAPFVSGPPPKKKVVKKKKKPKPIPTPKKDGQLSRMLQNKRAKEEALRQTRK